MCNDFGEPEFYDVTYPKARKAHWCTECLEDILLGTMYAKHTQKWEGAVSSTAFCVVCDAWATALSKAQRKVQKCAYWQYGALWTEIEEFTREYLGYDPDPRARPRRVALTIDVALADRDESGYDLHPTSS